MGWLNINGNWIGRNRGGQKWSSYWSPRNLTASLVNGGVKLDWDDNGKEYQVYYSTDNITFNFLDGVKTNTYTHFIDGGSTLYYKVRTQDHPLYSNFSNVVSIYVTDMDAYNLFVRMTALTETPSAARKTNIETTIRALKEVNLYKENFDALWVTRAHGVASAKLNIVNQYNAMTFTEKLNGSAPETGFWNICKLSNGDLLAGAGFWGARYYRSTDNGENWVYEGEVLAGSQTAYTFCDFGNGIVVAGVNKLSGGTYPDALDAHYCRSTDYGHTWSDLGHQGDMHYITLMYDLGGGVGIASCEKSPTPYETSVMRTTDYGLTWTEVGNGTTGMTVLNMLQPLEGGIIIAGGGFDSGNGIFLDNAHIIRSTDYGLTWTDVGEPLAGEVRLFGSCYMGNGIVLAGTTDNAHILRSDDYGETWADMGAPAVQKILTKLYNIGGGKALAFTAGAPSNGHIYMTDDWGLTWKDVGVMSAGFSINDCELAGDGKLLVVTNTYVGTPGKIYKSDVVPFSRSATNGYDSVKAGAGVLTFTEDGGFNSDETTSFLKTGLVLSAAAPNSIRKYKLTNCSFWFKVSGTQDTSGYDIIGTMNPASLSKSVYWMNRYAVGGFGMISGANQITIGYYATGYNCLSRANALNFNTYVNDVATNFVDNVAVDLPDNELYLCCVNYGGTENYFLKDRVELAGIGKSLTQAQFNTLRTIMNAYIAGL